MRRAPALQDLSRDHLKALIFAKRLKECVDAAAGGRTFARFWADECRHFRIEEEILLPRWAASPAGVDRELVVRMLEDHLAIRGDALCLSEVVPSLQRLHRLGERLHDHVRFEERAVFPAIERALEPIELERLGAALASARAEFTHAGYVK